MFNTNGAEHHDIGWLKNGFTPTHSTAGRQVISIFKYEKDVTVNTLEIEQSSTSYEKNTPFYMQ